ncbi:MAG TPA: hypothetical protein VGO68_19820 [Pyrinomonadaceae bacterium]|jgi:hypothetical protein|nr:hypothetical protein [Pyrinomonadaceae bacterium]
MTPEEELTAATREQLTKVRTALLRLHKTLLEFEREGYERARGKIDNSYAFLQLVMGDPWFAWLRQLSELIVEMDELLATKETPKESTARALIQQATILLTPAEAGSEFQKKYFAAMQVSPEVVLAHSEFAALLGPTRLSKEIH